MASPLNEVLKFQNCLIIQYFPIYRIKEYVIDYFMVL